MHTNAFPSKKILAFAHDFYNFFTISYENQKTSFAHTSKKRRIDIKICLLHTIVNLYVDEYDYEIEELCYLILKSYRLLLKKDYQISLKLDCFNIHNDGSACDVTAPDTVCGSS